MGTEYSGYRNRTTERVASNLGDYNLGFCEWIWEDIDYFAEDGRSKADAIDCLEQNMRDFFEGIHTELMGKCNPVERLFIEETEILDIDYRQIATAFLSDYKPAKKTAKPKTSKNVRKTKAQAGRTSRTTSGRR